MKLVLQPYVESTYRFPSGCDISPPSAEWAETLKVPVITSSAAADRVYKMSPGLPSKNAGL